MAKQTGLFDDLKKNRNLTIALFALIIVGFLVYGLFSGNGSRGFEVGDSYLRLSGPEGSQFEKTIAYEDIVSVNVLNEENYQPGECVRGEQTKKLIYGTWSNEEYGEYTLYILPRLTTYCVITTTDGVVVLNLESDRTTKEFAEALRSEIVK